MKDTLLITIIALTFGLVSCKSEGTFDSESNTTKETTNKYDKI
jgi:hypothetical protein